ncbi:methyltransferase domain-containing protein [Pseudanabaena minima]|uniref:methyltransferase domain-containing protein n=1 Tax=Pseudanabaena minima TaxID=890415 RepID=UPI003DA982E4
MEKNLNISQSNSKLEALIKVIGDPITHEPLEISPSYEHFISKEIFYPIHNNIPIMLVQESQILKMYGKRHLEAWKIVQSIGEESYLFDGMEGNFSTENWLPAKDISKIICQYIHKDDSVLDVGCGLLEKPAYIVDAFAKTKFFGVDPMLGIKERAFPFVQAYGDFLPFRSNIFEMILYVSSLDHLIKPIQSLREAYKILKPNGYVVIEETIRSVDKRYLQWFLKQQIFGVARYNKFHNHAFTFNSLINVIERAGFKNLQVYRTCEANEMCIVAQKI